MGLDVTDMEKHRVELRVLLDRHRRRFKNAKQAHTFEEIVSAELEKNRDQPETGQQPNRVHLESIDPDGIRHLGRFLDNLIDRGDARQQQELLQETLRRALQNSRRQSILVAQNELGMAGPLEPFCLFCASDLSPLNQAPIVGPGTPPIDQNHQHPIDNLLQQQQQQHSQPIFTGQQVFFPTTIDDDDGAHDLAQQAAPPAPIGTSTPLGARAPHQNGTNQFGGAYQQPAGQMANGADANQQPLQQQQQPAILLRLVPNQQQATTQAVTPPPSAAPTPDAINGPQVASAIYQAAQAAASMHHQHQQHQNQQQQQQHQPQTKRPKKAHNEQHQLQLSPPVVVPPSSDEEEINIDVDPTPGDNNDDDANQRPAEEEEEEDIDLDYRNPDSVMQQLDTFHETVVMDRFSRAPQADGEHQHRSSTPLSDTPTVATTQNELVIDESSQVQAHNWSQASVTNGQMQTEIGGQNGHRSQPQSSAAQVAAAAAATTSNNRSQQSSDHEYSQANSRPPSRSGTNGNKSIDLVSARLMQKAAKKIKLQHVDTKQQVGATKMSSQPGQLTRTILLTEVPKPPEARRGSASQPSGTYIKGAKSNAFTPLTPGGGVKTKRTVKRRRI